MGPEAKGAIMPKEVLAEMSLIWREFVKLTLESPPVLRSYIELRTKAVRKTNELMDLLDEDVRKKITEGEESEYDQNMRTQMKKLSDEGFGDHPMVKVWLEDVYD